MFSVTKKLKWLAEKAEKQPKYRGIAVISPKTSRGTSMSVVKQPQSCFGQVAMADIQFKARSRDDIPAVLKGLQYIYVTAAV